MAKVMVCHFCRQEDPNSGKRDCWGFKAKTTLMCLKTESRPGCLADNSEMGEEEGLIMQSFISYHNRKPPEGFKQGRKVI